MKKFLFFFVSLVVFLGVQNVFAQENPWVQVDDAIAGESVSIRASGFFDNESLVAVLNRPELAPITLPLQADENGNLYTDIAGLHARTAGEYSLDLQRSFGNTLFAEFVIAPGPVSAYRSTIEVRDITIPADGEAFSVVDVFAFDAYKNPVSNAGVKVVSSRTEDLVVMQPKTDQNGRSRGKIVSNVPGMSVLSVLLEEEVLSTKEEVVFHLDDAGLQNVGQGLGQFLKAQVFDDTETFADLGSFEIQDFPEEVIAGQTVSVRVLARDENGSLLQDYDGTVRFASSDNKVELPADYQFTKEDQGVHQFFLAVRFQTPGEHTLSVHDLNSFEKKGEVSVRVLSKDGEVPTETNPGTIQLITPENNGVYRSSRITITGTAPGLTAVKIRAGVAQVIIDDLPVDEDGSFVYQTPTLADGIYEFTALSLDDTIESSPLRITVDRTPPSNIAVELLPQGPIQKNELFNVSIASSEPISAATCILDGVTHELEQQSDTLYEKTIPAPNRCGDLPLSCSVSDTIGNTLEEPNAAVVQVSCEEGEENLPTTPSANQQPTAPTNVSAQPGEDRVTLFWSPARDDKTITQYRVSFVEDGGTNIRDNIVPDNRTQWYVDGLVPCEQYRFTVTALDEEGLESIPSEVITQGPICDALPSAPKTVDAGSGTPWTLMLLAMILGGGVVALFRHRA